MFDLDLQRIIEEINKVNKKKVLIQLPDGLKPRAAEIVEAIEENTSAKAFIWFSSCFGGCDLPLGLESLGIDLLVAIGHNRYNKASGGW